MPERRELTVALHRVSPSTSFIAHWLPGFKTLARTDAAYCQARRGRALARAAEPLAADKEAVAFPGPAGPSASDRDGFFAARVRPSRSGSKTRGGPVAAESVPIETWCALPVEGSSISVRSSVAVAGWRSLGGGRDFSQSRIDER